MKSLLLSLYRCVSGWLHDSKLVRALVVAQHRAAPIPIRWYNNFYSNKWASVFFAWYGHHVFYSAYDARKSDDEYWSSDESLYYYAVSQMQFRQSEIDRIFNSLQIEDHLGEGSVVVDLGCGTLKDMRKLVSEKIIRSKNIHGIDRNIILEKYFNIIGGLPESIHFHVGMMNELIKSLDHIDIVFVFGGTLQYLERHQAVEIFKLLAERGIKAVIIIGEGTDKADNIRVGGEWNYNLDRIAADAGYPENWRSLSCVRPNDVYEYWVLYDSLKVAERG